MEPQSRHTFLKSISSKSALINFAILATIVTAILAPSSTFAAPNPDLLSKITATKISVPFPESVQLWPEVSHYQAPANHRPSGPRYFSYNTAVWGNVIANFDDFRAKVAETFADSRGWTRGNFHFTETSGPADFTIVLSDPASLDALDGCSGDLSCRYGQYVIINDVRWRTGTTASNAAGMSARDYQHMVINHETGHWLGHEHIESCPNGGPAPVMLQQSTGLRGCTSMNPWPLDFELWTTR